jgi:preprotein translocase subunit SecB
MLEPIDFTGLYLAQLQARQDEELATGPAAGQA